MKKGYKAENELFHLLWKRGYAVARVAGSGSTTKPACDLIAGNRKKKFAIEVKESKENKKYIKKTQIDELKFFSENFGLKPLIAIKFKRKGWKFYFLKDLKKSENFLIAEIRKGKDISNLI